LDLGFTEKVPDDLSVILGAQRVMHNITSEESSAKFDSKLNECFEVEKVAG
jgi:hypothetical protein